jgi:RNA polymerase sigma-70 factor (ECF subfamily)
VLYSLCDHCFPFLNKRRIKPIVSPLYNVKGDALDEDTVMQQVADGDTQAFRQIVTAYQSQIVRYATRMLGDAEAAQDAAQETFVRLWGMRARYRPEQKLAALLLQIARRICLDYARTSRRETIWNERQTEIKSGTEQTFQANSLAEAVRDVLISLPEEQRTAFTLSHYEGLSYQEISETLDWPVGTVATRKRLAVEALRRRLAAWDEITEKEG